MNITPVNFNQKNYSINSQKQNVQFKAAKGAVLVNVLKEKGGTMSTEEMNAFVKKHFGKFSGKGVKDILEDLLPYIAGLTATSAGLLAAKNALEANKQTLENEKKALQKDNQTLQTKC